MIIKTEIDIIYLKDLSNVTQKILMNFLNPTDLYGIYVCSWALIKQIIKDKEDDIKKGITNSDIELIIFKDLLLIRKSKEDVFIIKNKNYIDDKTK